VKTEKEWDKEKGKL